MICGSVEIATGALYSIEIDWLDGEVGVPTPAGWSARVARFTPRVTKVDDESPVAVYPADGGTVALNATGTVAMVLPSALTATLPVNSKWLFAVEYIDPTGEVHRIAELDVLVKR
jgi:hypothetical protein